MKIVKLIVIILIAVVALVLIVALFVPRTYEVRREITINKPRQAVYDYIKLVKNQEQYNKWTMADAAMKRSFSGTDGTEGFVYAWNGNKEVGEGDQTITTLTDGQSVILALHFIRPFEGRAVTDMSLTEAPGGGTRLSWGMKGKSNYPMNFMNLFINGLLGKDLETSMQNLKNILEK